MFTSNLSTTTITVQRYQLVMHTQQICIFTSCNRRL